MLSVSGDIRGPSNPVLGNIEEMTNAVQRIIRKCLRGGPVRVCP